jgi:hypothetical protein
MTRYAVRWIPATVAVWALAANADNLATLKAHCGAACARAQNDNQLVQLGVAKIRADCVALENQELFRHEGSSATAVKALQEARAFADRCLLRSGTFWGDFSWSEALANLKRAKDRWETARAGGVKERFERYDRGAEQLVADVWDLSGAPPERVRKMEAFCRQESGKLAHLETSARAPAVAAAVRQNSYVADIVTTSLRRAHAMAEKCSWIVSRRMADAVGPPSDLADMVATVGRALASLQRPAGTDPVQQDLSEARARIQRARALLAGAKKGPAQPSAGGAATVRVAFDRAGAARQLLREANQLFRKASREEQAAQQQARLAAGGKLPAAACVALGAHLVFAALVAAEYIEAHRSVAVLFNGSPLTSAEMAFLAPFFPARLLSGVRIFEGEHAGFLNDDALAVTYGSDVIFTSPGNRTNTTLKHEMVHICQYDLLGVRRFAGAYMAGYIDAGCDYATNVYEKQAKTFELSGTGRIDAFLGYCR